MSSISWPCRLSRILCSSGAALALTLAVPSAAWSTKPLPGALVVPASDALLPVRASIVSRVASGEIACVSILAFADGQIVWEEGIGWADAERKVAASSTTIFPIASISKSLVGLATTILMDEGRFSFDTPVSEVLTTFQVRKGDWVERTLRVADLAAMTAAMPHGSIMWLRNAPPISGASTYAVRSFAIVDADTDDVRYSNYTTGVLECVVADVSGLGFAEFVEQRIFRPLGMNSSAAEPDLNRRAEYASLTWGDGFDLDDPPTMVPAAGLGFYSTVSDLGKLALAHLGLGDDVGRSKADTPSLEVMKRSRQSPDGGNDYWLGWGGLGDDRRFEMTNGQTFDATSAIVLCREEHAAVICLTNTQWDGEPGNSMRLADALAMRAMESIVPGCLESFERAKAEHEAKPAKRTTEVPSDLPLEPFGRWDGVIDLAGRTYEATLEIRDDHSATMRFGTITATTERISVDATKLRANFECEGEMEVVDEISPITYLSLAISPIADDCLAGSTIFAFYADDRAAVGTVAALTSFTRTP